MTTATANSCFVSPPRLSFDHTVQNSKQVVTLYNMRTEAVSFRILTSAPRKFVVKPSHGQLPPNTLMELIVRLQDMEMVGKAKMIVEFLDAAEETVGKSSVSLDVRSTPIAAPVAPAPETTPVTPRTTSALRSSTPSSAKKTTLLPALPRTTETAHTSPLSLAAGAIFVVVAFIIYLEFADVDGVVRAFLWRQLDLSTYQLCFISFLAGMASMATIREYV